MKNPIYFEREKANSISLSLEQIGYEKCKPLHKYGPAIRQHYLIHYIIRGKGIYNYADKQIEVFGNELFLVPPNEVISYQADKIEPWEYYWFGFNGIEAKQLLEMIGLTKTTRKQKYYLSDLFSIDEFIIMLTNHRVENESDKILEIAKLYELISWLRRSYERNNKVITVDDIENKYLKVATEYIERSYTIQITVSDIADYVGIDRTQLFRYFKDYFGIGPKEYLIQLRMNRAEGMLKNTKLRIKEIAYSVGYIDQYLFSKMFKKIHSVSPKQYRIDSKYLLLVL